MRSHLWVLKEEMAASSVSRLLPALHFLLLHFELTLYISRIVGSSESTLPPFIDVIPEVFIQARVEKSNLI